MSSSPPKEHPVVIEFHCHYCHQWFPTEQTEGHFSIVHSQKNVTFDKLQERLASLGGLETREVAFVPQQPGSGPISEPVKPDIKYVNWMYAEDQESEEIQTNNSTNSRS
jgi:hypothetical protein